MRVLVVNAGSSSLKLSLIDGDETLGSEQLDAPWPSLDEDALRAAVDRLAGAEAVGHRFVHGGSRFREPVVLDATAEAGLDELESLAPQHQRRSLAALVAVRAVLPGLPEVACFDTAFHADLPAEAATYALPSAWRERWDLRRFGFHGLAHAYAARTAAAMLGGVPERLVTCHLGSGASLAAIRAGRSVDTTMGFTPLEGLVMGTRSGSVDPGLLLWLLEHGGLGADELADGLEHHAGLLGLAGTADMREVDPGSTAFAVYVHRLSASIAAMAASLGGLDALTFGGGVGEHNAPVRAAVGERLAFLGVTLDPPANEDGPPQRDVSAEGAAVRTLVIPAREDLEIAAGVERALS
jgi:acetate kinase